VSLSAAVSSSQSPLARNKLGSCPTAATLASVWRLPPASSLRCCSVKSHCALGPASCIASTFSRSRQTAQSPTKIVRYYGEGIATSHFSPSRARLTGRAPVANAPWIVIMGTPSSKASKSTIPKPWARSWKSWPRRLTPSMFGNMVGQELRLEICHGGPQCFAALESQHGGGDCQCERFPNRRARHSLDDGLFVATIS
jgi:hypothetical protein